MDAQVTAERPGGCAAHEGSPPGWRPIARGLGVFDVEMDAQVSAERSRGAVLPTKGRPPGWRPIARGLGVFDVEMDAQVSAERSRGAVLPTKGRPPGWRPIARGLGVFDVEWIPKRGRYLPVDRLPVTVVGSLGGRWHPQTSNDRVRLRA